MPNKTLSVREDELTLWERASRAARNSHTTVSALVASALAHYLRATETITVRMYNSNGADRLEAFTGRWLVNAQLDSDQDPDRHKAELLRGRFGHKGANAEWRTGIAETGRGRIAVYLHHWDYFNDFPPELHVFDDLDTALHKLAGDGRIPPGVWTDARIALVRLPVVWRDI
ncbi:hypothetical protein [Nonomuraea sp. NPDC050643]|uniref:hypothetical protein n=1 Tax=Nonomuraea sp. NPDC050643 TaxID=3155660 RepID=UPI0033E7B15D